jgi:diguanylate cyclase (GGDEF)-like protein
MAVDDDMRDQRRLGRVEVATADGADDPARELARLTAALSASGDVVYEWDLARDAIVWHGSVARLFPDGAPPTTGDALAAAIHPEDQPERARALNDHLALGLGYDCEYRLAGTDGAGHWVHDRGGVVRGDAAGGARMMGTMRLVTRRKATEARLYYLANYDELTGHANKARLQDALDAEVRRCVREGGAGAFAVVGVDQLAMINSAYGYEAGDDVLIAVGQRLSRCLRGTDMIGRIGGDRFGVVLTDCDRDAAYRATERAVEAVHREPIATPSGAVRITVTGGVVTFPGQSRASAEIIAKAESALHEAKRQGRNQTGVYAMTEEQRAQYRKALEIGADVEAALQDDRLCFAYQPIRWAGSGAAHSHECLLRLAQPDGAIVSAGAFVPAIEDLGLMRTVERRVLDLAIDTLDAHPGPSLAINISGLTASDPTWLRRLTGRLRGRPDLATRLIVEITETAALRDLAESARFVRAVRELGVRVALDDFGAGYTNFQHLKSLPVDIVKIDGTFVRAIDRDPQNRLFVRNLIALARAMNVVTLAECVESADEAEALATEGADLVQGYHCGVPAFAIPAPSTANATAARPASAEAGVGTRSPRDAAGSRP